MIYMSSELLFKLLKSDKFMKRLFIAVFVLAASAFFASADDRANAINGMYYTQTLVDLAEKGDVQAQNTLGIVFQEGNGIEKDLQKAVYWYAKAVEGGSPNAMVNLGAMYLQGKGVDQNFETAINLYKRAADLNNQAALYNLARLYLAGAGVEKNPVLGFEYAKRAADGAIQTTVYNENDADRRDESEVYGDALLLVAVCYRSGLGTAPDMKLSMKYAKRAAEAGSADACMALAESYEKGEGVELDLQKAAEYKIRAEKLKAAGKKSRF